MDHCNLELDLDLDSDSVNAVFFHIIRLHFLRSHELFEKVGIYPGQHAMLWLLNKEDGRNQKELAEKLRTKPATITVMLTRMEKINLVERRQDTKDQRVSRVYITKHGREVFKELKEVMQQLSEECFANFTDDEKVILRRLLMQVRDNLIKVCSKC